MGKGAETPTKAEAGKLKRDVCVAESECLLFRVTRADCTTEYYTSPPARVGNESFRRRGARWLYNENTKDSPARNRVTDSSGSRAERSHVVESAKPGKPPARVPRGARREGAGGAQRRATRFAEGWNDPSPWRGTCEGKTALPPKAFPRNASCPPRGRGNERFLLSFNGRTRSARHRNILHKTQNSAVLHVNFPDSFARLNDSFVPDPRGCCSIVFQKTIRARPLSGRTPFSRLRER